MIISKKARIEYNLNDFINYENHIAIFDDYYSAKIFAENVNKIRNSSETPKPEKYVRASVINALGILDELYLTIIEEYFKGNASIRSELWIDLEKKIGKENYYNSLEKFADVFPSAQLFTNKITFEEYMKSSSDGIDNKNLLINEMILSLLTQNNKGIDQIAYKEFFDDNDLFEENDLKTLFTEISDFFIEKEAFPPKTKTNLIEFLETPFKENKTLEDQLKYISIHWSKFLNSKQLSKILSAIAYILEENDFIWRLFHPGGSFSPILTYNSGDYEAFSEDKDWMPNVVMIAKSMFVWLDQLSKKYQRSIYRLDQIPDEELLLIRNRGINAIWLIGLWERSKASRKLKNDMGNSEALASAYSLQDYSIAYDLGGYQSYENLRDRARKFGIRLASDMVPNHMGIDSYILLDRPDFFISLDHSPFPSYSFNGQNYSENPDFGLFIEDHYYNHSDAAVVFKYVNFRTGTTRYIYHGNDGTSTPWNDTAQLDFLKEEVRNWVVQNIIRVARMFPIIRFDAAMTLAKAQFQRLWYPVPGTPGGVASRSSYSVSSELFNKLFPNEFWREVVDTVAREVPDTLLLAEAFWMLEGYFVRTLGMHRVYNSAFMNMLKSELNDQYRTTIKNTLEFDPEILKRFVNFMNNPDEDTALAQFGKEDKYFGVLLMMVTMPGLPMIGHGQIEGFSEKYGMEFRKANWNEQEDNDLIKRHEIEIFPLLHRRWLFSDVKYFRLFDFYHSDGGVDENVFAYSNGTANKKALIVYHNRYAGTSGWIKTSARFLNRWSDDREFMQENLADSLSLSNKNDVFVVFKDYKSHLEYIRRTTDLSTQGMFLILGAYNYHIFMDFYEVEDTTDKIYARIHDFLNGNGTRSIYETQLEIEQQNIHNALGVILNKEFFSLQGSNNFQFTLYNSLLHFFHEIAKKEQIKFMEDNMINNVKTLLNLWSTPQKIEELLFTIKNRENFRNLEFETLQEEFLTKNPLFFVQICLLFTGDDSSANTSSFNEKSFIYIDKYRLRKIVNTFFRDLGYSTEKAEENMHLLLILIKYFSLPEDTYPSNFILYLVYDLFNDPLISDYLKINYYNGEYWYNKERFLTLMVCLTLNIIFYNKPDLTLKLVPKLFSIIDASTQSEYKLNSLRKVLKTSEHKKIIIPFPNELQSRDF